VESDFDKLTMIFQVAAHVMGGFGAGINLKK
jgi:hypothetical protein